MARNAQAERDLYATGQCDMAAFDATPEGRRYQDTKARLLTVERDLGILAQAAGFNPKAPLGPSA